MNDGPTGGYQLLDRFIAEHLVHHPEVVDQAVPLAELLLAEGTSVVQIVGGVSKVGAVIQDFLLAVLDADVLLGLVGVGKYLVTLVASNPSHIWLCITFAILFNFDLRF